MYKRFIAISFLMFSLVGVASASTSGLRGCYYKHMHDPCAIDGYDIVEIEGVSRCIPKHSYSTHHKHRRMHRYHKRFHHSRIHHHAKKLHYRYIRKCRTVAVPVYR